MTGTDGHSCSWTFLPSVRRELDKLSAQGRGLLVQTATRYGKGEALPRQVKALSNGLLELRATAGNIEFRLVFFLPAGGRAVALAAFQKGTPAEQRRKIKVARKRMAEFRAQDSV